MTPFDDVRAVGWRTPADKRAFAAQEARRRRRRCQASRAPNDPRCNRQATEGDLCDRHAVERLELRALARLAATDDDDQAIAARTGVAVDRVRELRQRAGQALTLDRRDPSS